MWKNPDPEPAPIRPCSAATINSAGFRRYRRAHSRPGIPNPRSSTRLRCATRPYARTHGWRSGCGMPPPIIPRARCGLRCGGNSAAPRPPIEKRRSGGRRIRPVPFPRRDRPRVGTGLLAQAPGGKEAGRGRRWRQFPCRRRRRPRSTGRVRGWGCRSGHPPRMLCRFQRLPTRLFPVTHRRRKMRPRSEDGNPARETFLPRSARLRGR